MSDGTIKFLNGNSIEAIGPSSGECVRGHRSEMPLYYDDWLIDKEMLDEALKPFESDSIKYIRLHRVSAFGDDTADKILKSEANK